MQNEVVNGSQAAVYTDPAGQRRAGVVAGRFTHRMSPGDQRSYLDVLGDSVRTSLGAQPMATPTNVEPDPLGGLVECIEMATGQLGSTVCASVNDTTAMPSVLNGPRALETPNSC